MPSSTFVMSPVKSLFSMIFNASLCIKSSFFVASISAILTVSPCLNIYDSPFNTNINNYIDIIIFVLVFPFVILNRCRLLLQASCNYCSSNGSKSRSLLKRQLKYLLRSVRYQKVKSDNLTSFLQYSQTQRQVSSIVPTYYQFL